MSAPGVSFLSPASDRVLFALQGDAAGKPLCLTEIADRAGVRSVPKGNYRHSLAQITSTSRSDPVVHSQIVTH